MPNPRRTLLPFLFLAALASVPASGLAHAILVHSRPEAGGTAAAGPVEMEFRFNSRIDCSRSRLTLVAPERAPEVLRLLPDTPPDVLRTDATLRPGQYVVRWQVLAVDGHITRGDVPFAVPGP